MGTLNGARSRRWFFGLAVLALACVVGGGPALEAYANWLIVSDRVEPADVAVTLSGGEGERLRAAIQLFRGGTARAILIVGPDSPLLKVYTSEDSLTLGEAKRRIAVKKGVSADAVFLALGASSTFEEATRALAACREHGWRSIVVTTSPFHTRRARATFRSVFRGTGIGVAVHHLPLAESQNDPHRWWRREGDAMEVVDETIKIAYYAYRHHVAPWS